MSQVIGHIWITHAINQDTNASHAHIQTMPDSYSTLKPAHTHHTPHIEPKDLKTS